MAEQKDIRPPELESALFEFYAGPQPDAAFAARLEEQLRRRQTESVLPERPTHVSLWASRRSLMKTLRARPLLALLVAVLAVLVLTGVAYAIGRLAGFIPGVGFVEDVQSVLKEPVVVTREIPAPTANNGSQGAGLSVGAGGLATQNRDGITITVKEAVAEADRLVVVYTVTGLPADLFSRSPEQAQPAEEPQPDQVRLPDGTVLSFHSGSGCQGWGDGVQTEVTCRLEFPPLPAGVQTFTLEIQRLTNARPGELPENWQIPVRLAPVSPTQMAGGVEEPGLSSPVVEGIRLLLIKAAQTPAQTAFQLAVQWEGQQRMVHHTGPVALQDAQGRYYLLSGGPEGGRYSADEPNFSTLSSLVTTRLAAGQPVTFRLDWIIMSAFGQDVLHFDPGANPQVGQEWTLDQEVEAGGFSLRFIRARLKESPDDAPTLEFDIEAPKG
ncbi:MAG: hypothetical protein GYA59_17365, partial [Chloroflexi bacterium]|nr:hypothetical protein [Chloroflexota bacterium]